MKNDNSRRTPRWGVAGVAAAMMCVASLPSFTPVQEGFATAAFWSLGSTSLGVWGIAYRYAPVAGAAIAVLVVVSLTMMLGSDDGSWPVGLALPPALFGVIWLTRHSLAEIRRQGFACRLHETLGRAGAFQDGVPDPLQDAVRALPLGPGGQAWVLLSSGSPELSPWSFGSDGESIEATYRERPGPRAIAITIRLHPGPKKRPMVVVERR